MKYNAISNPVIQKAKIILFNKSFLNMGSTDKKSLGRVVVCTAAEE